MAGMDDLRRQVTADKPSSAPSVVAPKIVRFCEEHLLLAGRLVASRLMLELTPFLGTSAASIPSTADVAASRQRLVATRDKLDQTYASAERLRIGGRRDWLIDIRGTLMNRDEILTPPSRREEIPESSSPKSNAGLDSTSQSVDSIPEGLREDVQEDACKRSSPNALGCALSATKAVAAASTTRSSGFKMRRNSGREVNKSEGESTKQSSSTTGRLGAVGVSLRRLKLGSQKGARAREDGASEYDDSVPATLASVETGVVEHQSPKGSGLNTSQTSMLKEEQETKYQHQSPLHGEASCDKHLSRSQTTRRGNSPDTVNNSVRELGPDVSGDPSSKKHPYTQPQAAEIPAAANGRSVHGSKVEPSKAGKRVFAGGLWGAGQAPSESITNMVGSSEGSSDPCGEVGVEKRDAHDENIASKARAYVEDTSLEGARVQQMPPSHLSPSPAHEPSAARPTSKAKRRFAGGAMGSATPTTSKSVISRDDVTNPFGPASARDTHHQVAGSGQEMFRPAVGSFREGSFPEVEKSLPDWAAGNDAVPDWAADSVAPPVGTTSENGFGIAPPSRLDAKREALDAKRSPLLAEGLDDKPAKRPIPRRDPSGARRAFGGGASLF